MLPASMVKPQADQFSEYYSEYMDGMYDSVDRIVLNVYNPLLQTGGGFRHWWRQMYGSDEDLDKTHVIRFAGRFSRRVHAYADATGIPVIHCKRGVRKHELAEEYVPQERTFTGVFLILASRYTAPVWEVWRNEEGKGLHLSRKFSYVKQYWFHIIDAEWGHITIRLSPHPPFGAQIFLNGHEYLARQAEKEGIEFDKEGNCFSNISDAAGLAQIADALYSSSAIGRMRQVCERWIYSTCLCFALGMVEQEKTDFHYQYSVYQLEYSRNLLFHCGAQMEQVFDSVIERLRTQLDVNMLKTIFGRKKRPSRRKGKKAPRLEVAVERPTYDLTVFKLHFDALTVKLYTKGERILRIEVVAHHVKRLPVLRSLHSFSEIVSYLKGILFRFLDILHGIDAAFVSDEFLDTLPHPSQVGKTRVGGLNLDIPRIRAVIEAVIALASTPHGFTASDLARMVRTSLGDDDYSTRQASYDLKKLRGKQLVRKIGNSRRYEPTQEGLPRISALLILREKVIKPVLAGAAKIKRGPKPKLQTRIEQLYQSLLFSMRDLLLEFGLAL